MVPEYLLTAIQHPQYIAENFIMSPSVFVTDFIDELTRIRYKNNHVAFFKEFSHVYRSFIEIHAYNNTAITQI